VLFGVAIFVAAHKSKQDFVAELLALDVSLEDLVAGALSA
jgi:hypothetical protein